MKTITINNDIIEIKDDFVDATLLEFLHHQQKLTGTKYSCGIGICKSCSVCTRSLSTEPYVTKTSCSLPIERFENLEILTVEGLSKDGTFSEMQKAFLEEFSFQCGYCTPGFLMTTVAFLDHLKQHPNKLKHLDAEIDLWFNSNICRCTGYEKYFSAIKKVVLRTMN